MGKEMRSVLSEVRQSDEIRAVLLTGEGRGFCAGQDLAEVKEQPDLQLGEIIRNRYNPIIEAIRTIEIPFVCAVNGVAAGAGANLALACDIVLASTKASFIQSFSKIGLIPDSGGTFILPRLVGFQRAMALALLGDKLSAEKALELGLVYKVYEPEELSREAAELTSYLATQPTKGLGLIKRGLNASLSNSLEEQLELEMELQTLAGQTYDYKEGIAAFLEKRAPVFEGR
jgi:2-(1,2-epoxy-1,2-dihydrophenyl)acetyl-CoA isomerase